MTTHKDLALELLIKEATFLDDRKWDEWLALYTPDCEYWAPTWRTEDSLTNDPRTELSHIYYGSRAGLEDRIVRIRSGKSPASSPMRRTAHMLGLMRLTSAPSDSQIELRTTWATHVFDPRRREQFTFFGYSEYLLIYQGDWRIKRKKVIVQNDYFPAVVDVYCL